MAGDVYNQLLMLGEKWLKREGSAVIARELVTGGAREQAGAIGFRSNCAAVIESKASRSDFIADARKPHRVSDGLGAYPFYLSPPGIIEGGDLPERWGCCTQKDAAPEMCCKPVAPRVM